MVDKFDWPTLLSEFEQSTAGQMLVEEGYRLSVRASDSGEPSVYVNAPDDFLDALRQDSTLPLVSTLELEQ